MNVVALLTATLVLATATSALGQEPVTSPPTPLSQLLAEAQANNPQISGANYGVRAARQMAPQVTTLPDPKFTYQQLSVGSPKPFAGYTNSDFSYIGVGASQALPYPGKLRARGAVAEREADTRQAEVEVTKASIADAVKADYLQLAYLQQTLGILQQNESVLDQLIQDATAHYQVGQGMQQDVLQAQVNRTKIVKEITMHHQQMGQIQANLKGLLNRDQGSPDIVTEDLIITPLQRTSEELLAMVRQNNPQIQVDASSIRKQDAQLTSAKREGKPDFEVGYIYENTDRKYRDYYMFTFDVRVPRKARVNAEIAEATEKRSESEQTLNAHLQQQLAEVREEYVKATSDEELLKEYREGLIPQSDAAYRATEPSTLVRSSVIGAGQQVFLGPSAPFDSLCVVRPDERKAFIRTSPACPPFRPENTRLSRPQCSYRKGRSNKLLAPRSFLKMCREKEVVHMERSQRSI